MERYYHKPVFEDSFIQYLNIQPDQKVLDCTCGEGGHSSIILKRIGENGFLVGIDRDKEIIEIAKKRLLEISNNFIILNYSYSEIEDIQKESGIEKFDRILVDLGLSTYHLGNMRRGFSFNSDELLDMRFDKDKTRISAKDIVNKFSEKAISDIIFTYGEERMANRIARAIIDERKRNCIDTCRKLSNIVNKAYGYHHGKINSATKTFQGLRIYVNSELDELKKLLNSIHLITKKDGIIGIISYHSLEDRIVKVFLKSSIEFKIINKKVIKPELDEIYKNPPSRSAKLRLASKI